MSIFAELGFANIITREIEHKHTNANSTNDFFILPDPPLTICRTSPTAKIKPDSPYYLLYETEREHFNKPSLSSQQKKAYLVITEVRIACHETTSLLSLGLLSRFGGAEKGNSR
jgi:hypothetical protein